MVYKCKQVEYISQIKQEFSILPPLTYIRGLPVFNLIGLQLSYQILLGFLN